MRFDSLVCFMLGVSLFASGQTVSPSITQGQKTLKRLLNDAPQIRSVKFNDCRVSLKAETSRGFVWSAGPSGNVGGGFPQDESSNYLSGGADRTVFDVSRNEYEFDLSLLDTSKITINDSVKKGRSILTIFDNPTGAVTSTKPNKILSKYRPGVYVLVTKSKSAEKTLLAFKDLATICSERKDPV